MKNWLPLLFIMLLAALLAGCAAPVTLPETDEGQEEVVLVWERSGGIAGICERLTVRSNGEYYLEDCVQNKVTSQGQLSAEQFAQIQALQAQYGDFEWAFTPPQGSADMFMDRYSFNGRGQEIPNAGRQEELNGIFSGIAAGLELSEPQGKSESGIQGIVMLGPTCPGPVPAEDPEGKCADKPYQTVVTVLGAGNSPVLDFQSGPDGTFRVPLPPGTYTLRPQPGNPLPRAGEIQVTVEEGKFTEVLISYDSGMR